MQAQADVAWVRFSDSVRQMCIIGLKKTAQNLKANYYILEVDKLYWFIGQKGTSETRENCYVIPVGINTYIPQKARGFAEDDGIFTKDDFVYDRCLDAYICPNGCMLGYRSFKKGFGAKRYKSKTSDCAKCPLRGKCLRGKQKSRCIERSYHWTEYEKQHENDGTDRYLGIQRLRKIWCEGTFSHQKARHCMVRAKMRGIAQTKGQCLLSACAVNLKRMIKWMKGKPIKHDNFTTATLFAHLWAFFIPFCQQLRNTTYLFRYSSFTVIPNTSLLTKGFE
jgi:hypothetical protein